MKRKKKYIKLVLFSLTILLISMILYMAIKSDYEVTESNYQWYLGNEGQEINGILGVEGEDIGYSSALQLNGNGIVAIIDTGVNFKVSNIEESMFINANEIPDNNIDDDGNGYVDDVSGWDFYNNDNSQYDLNGNDHGTALVNIMVGFDEDEYRQLVKGVQILSIKVFENDEYRESDIIKAIDYAEEMGAKVVMMSFELTNYNEKLYNVMLNSDMFFVCSAGNSNSNLVNYPAGFDIDNMIVVGGINNKGYSSLSTNYGIDVDIYAPADNIYSINALGDYSFYSGTSFAVPQVASIAIYLAEVYNIESYDLKEEILIYSRKSKSAMKDNDYLSILDLDIH